VLYQFTNIRNYRYELLALTRLLLLLLLHPLLLLLLLPCSCTTA
jgi:hypothetical protein